MKKLFFFLVICLTAMTSQAQNVGIGTSSPLNKLHVAGGMRLDTLTGVAGSGIVTHNAAGVLYGIKFSGSINDVLRGDGSFGPSGTGGGSSFWLANGSSIYNSNAGNVGVGTTAPQSRFHANGTSWFSGDNTPLPPAAGRGVAIGQAGDNGYLFSFDYASFSPRTLLIQSPGGSVGIGTTSPAFTVDIKTPTFGGGTRTISDGAANFIVQTNGGTNSWARYYMRSNNRSWFIGTSQNFNGDQLYINDETAGQTRMVINTNGNVGIGTTTPLVKLHVNGTGAVESSIQSTNERAIFSLNSTIAGQNRVWTLENGVFGNAGQFAIYDRTAGQARLSIQPAGPINVQGNTTQDLGSFGQPKAMIQVNGDGAILRCYNGVSGATGSCGYSVTRILSNQYYVVDFGFNIQNRFYAVCVQSQFGEVINYDLDNTTPTKMYITVVDHNSASTDRPFSIIIY